MLPCCFFIFFSYLYFFCANFNQFINYFESEHYSINFLEFYILRCALEKRRSENILKKKEDDYEPILAMYV